MTARTMPPASADVRAEASRRARRSRVRWRVLGFPIVLLAVGLLACLALYGLHVAMGVV